MNIRMIAVIAIGLFSASCSEISQDMSSASNTTLDTVSQAVYEEWDKPKEEEPGPGSTIGVNTIESDALLRYLSGEGRVFDKVKLIAIPRYSYNDLDFGDDDVVGSATFEEDSVEAEIDGTPVDADGLMDYINKRDARRLDRITIMLAMRKSQAASLQDELKGMIDPQILEEQIDAGGAITLEVQDSELDAFMKKAPALFDAIDLYREPTYDDLTGAMLATSANWVSKLNLTGDGVGIYMTDGGCPDPGPDLPRYYRLSGSPDSHAQNVASIIRGISPSVLYCNSYYTTGRRLPTVSEMWGVPGQAPVSILTMSMGWTPDNNEYGVLDKEWDDFAHLNSVLMFKSAGNRGDFDGWVTSPGKAYNIVSVGAYDHRNMTQASFSSHVNRRNTKPEVLAPGVGITAGGYTMSGTSMASPHAAAISAALTSTNLLAKIHPTLGKAQLLAGATDSINGQKGGAVGGVDFYDSLRDSSIVFWRSLPNRHFSFYDFFDYLPPIGLSHSFVIKHSNIKRARVVLTWQNRGAYLYAHRHDAHPIGMDLDLCVYGPNGLAVGCSASWDNPYEIVDFYPAQSGVYRIAVRRYANRDPFARVDMGIWVGLDR